MCYSEEMAYLRDIFPGVWVVESRKDVKKSIKARSEKSKTERTIQRVLRSQGNY